MPGNYTEYHISIFQLVLEECSEKNSPVKVNTAQ